MRLAWTCLLLGLVAVGSACDDAGRPQGDDDQGGVPDASEPPELPDASIGYIDADNQDGGCAPATCQNPVDDGCLAAEVCNNGLDDDCDTVIDEGCACTAGTVQACFFGQPGRLGVGACSAGTQTCEGDSEFGNWGPCTGGIFPGPEVCDGLDNNCNGCADDDPDCCSVLTACPGPGSLPEAQPFADYPIDGLFFFGGQVTKWTWTVVGGPCDVLLAPNQSFKLNGMSATTVTGPTLSTLTFHPTLSGDYTITVLVTLADGTTESCTFIVHVRGPGLRVELCWEKTGGGNDVDLHVHRPGSTTPWFNNADDCYYANCKAGATGPNWGSPNSPLSECVNAPGGATWAGLGYCRNPRLDIDNITTVGVPENINLDTPLEGATYRVAVHYFNGGAVTHPIVNIYCGGNRLGTFGQIPDQLQNFEEGHPQVNGPIWRVVDVTTHVDTMTGETTGCDLVPLTLPSDPTEPFVTCPEPGSPDGCSDISY